MCGLTPQKKKKSKDASGVHPNAYLYMYTHIGSALVERLVEAVDTEPELIRLQMCMCVCVCVYIYMYVYVYNLTYRRGPGNVQLLGRA